MCTYNELMESSKRCEVFDEKFLDELIECCSYGSIGTLNWVIDVLQIIKERVENGQKIKYEIEDEGSIFLDLDSLKILITQYFPDYVLKGVFTKVNLKNKVFFKLENTSEGMDLVYTGNSENKLFKWIADINKEQCLMRILPTNVVYIRNNRNNTYTPFVTEHNSSYIYDETDGKIKEIF